MSAESRVFTVYKNDTGEIYRILTTYYDEPHENDLAPDDGFLVGSFDPELYWVNLALRQAELKTYAPYYQDQTQIIADGVDELDISGLTNPCTVIWPDGVESEVTDGSIQWSVDYPGTYNFKLSSHIHLETEVSVEAVAVS